MQKSIIALLVILSFISVSQAQVVCSEDELARELREDIEDNGKLDCQRESYVPEGVEEKEEDKAKRIAAQWNGDCSFEAENTGDADWAVKLQRNYSLKKGLVDVNGEPVESDFADQADMCEIVRAMIASGKLTNVSDDVSALNVDVVDHIDCAGTEGQTEVCAATGYSFANKAMWYILLEGGSLQFYGEPSYIVAPEEPEEETPIEGQTV